tara:strand:+ start:2220 stop:2399 length:180 start_codon:yes stop_codon:yes gene_type:complete
MNREIKVHFSHNKLEQAAAIKSLTDRSFSVVVQRIFEQGLKSVKQMNREQLNELMKDIS